jgi:hypothetical protein
MEYIILIGWLRKVYFDDVENEHINYYFECEDNHTIPIIFESLEQAADTPINRRIALSVIEYTDGSFKVSSDEKYFTFVDDYAEDIIPNKKHVAILFQVHEGSTQDTKDKALISVTRDAEKVENYYKYFSKYFWDVQVRGYVFESNSSAEPPTWGGKDADDLIKSITDFSPNYRMILSDNNAISSGCGRGLLGGAYSIVYKVCGVKTMIHELGHNFGLQHAATIDKAGIYKEYGDESSIMGSNTVKGLNSPNVVQLGFENDREIDVILDSRQVLIAPIELNEHALHQQEYQNIIIKKDKSNDFYLSLRKPIGTSYVYFKPPETLYIHELDKERKTVRQLPDLLPGSNRGLSNGVKLEYIDFENDAAKVNILFPSSPITNVIERPITEFPITLPTVSIADKHTGFWWNRFFVGQGFDLQIKNNRMLLYWYTFNQKEEGSLRYYFSTCDLIDAKIGFDILTTDKGTFDNPKLANVKKIGRGQIYFFDTSRGVFNFNTEEHGRGSTEIFPLAITNSVRTGAYYNPELSGSGHTTHFIDNDKKCVDLWYTYGPEKKTFGAYIVTSQRWYISEGYKMDTVGDHGGDLYDMKISEIKGGNWLDVQKTEEIQIGTATLEFENNNQIRWKYNLEDGKSGEDIIIRLF